MQEFKHKSDVDVIDASKNINTTISNSKPKKKINTIFKRTVSLLLCLLLIGGLCFNTNLINALAGTATVTLKIGNNGRFDVEYTDSAGNVKKETYDGYNDYYNYDYRDVSLNVKTGTDITVYMVPDGQPGGNGDFNTSSSASIQYLDSNANRGYTILDFYLNGRILNKYDYGASTVGVIDGAGNKLSDPTQTAKIITNVQNNTEFMCTFTKIYEIGDSIRVPVHSVDNGYIYAWAYCVDDHYIDYDGNDVGYYFMTQNVCKDSSTYDSNDKNHELSGVSALGYPCEYRKDFYEGLFNSIKYDNNSNNIHLRSNKQFICVTGNRFVSGSELDKNYYTNTNSSVQIAKSLYGLNDVVSYRGVHLKRNGTLWCDKGTSGFQGCYLNFNPTLSRDWQNDDGYYFGYSAVWSCVDIKRYSSLMKKYGLNVEPTEAQGGNGTAVRDIFYYDRSSEDIGDSFWIPPAGRPDGNKSPFDGYTLSCGNNRNYIAKNWNGTWNRQAETTSYGWTFALPNGIYPVNTFTARVAETDELLFTAQFDNIKSCRTTTWNNPTHGANRRVTDSFWNQTYYVNSIQQWKSCYTKFNIQTDVSAQLGYSDATYNVNNKVSHPVLASDILPGYKIKGFYLDSNDVTMSYANTNVYDQYGNVGQNANGTISSFMMNWFGTNITYRYDVTTYLAVLDKQGGTGGTDGPIKFMGGRKLSDYSKSKSVNPPTKEGYTFKGYFKDLDDSNTMWYDQNGNCTNITTPKENVTLYAKWEPNIYTVTYDKDDSLATLGLASGYNAVESVTYGGYVDTRTTTHYGSKLGWDFMGWSLLSNPKPSDVLASGTDVYKIPAKNITLYGGYKRTFTLIFAKDVLTNTPEKSYSKTIYNDDTAFNYAQNEISETTKKTDAHYVTTLEPNGGTLVSKGKTDSSSDINNNKITSTTSFKGWYTSNTGGNQVGISDTSIIVTPSTTDATKYTVKGNISGSTTITSSNNSTTLYPRWNEAYIILPDVTRNTDKADGNGTASDKFLGWFTNPQPDTGSGNGGTYIGKAGDKVKISSDMTLYAWFNTAPTLTKSELTNTFFENQPITNDQLLSLVNGKDVDDPNLNGTIEWIGTKAWVDKYKEQAESLFRSTYTTDASVLQPIQTTVNGVTVTIDNPDKDRYMSQEDMDKAIDKMLNNINYDNFKPVITSIEYKRNGIDSRGNKYTDESEYTQDAESVKNDGLLTETKNIGDIIIHYSITDNGIMNDGKLITDSEITVDFTLDCKIRFNEIPKLYLTSGYIFADDDKINSDTIESIIINRQIAQDAEDLTDNKPWWDKDVTTKNLKDSVYIVGVYDIMMQSAYEYEYPDKAAAIKQITDVKELFKLKETDKEAFNAITNFKVEMDCHDQWSKNASDLQSRLSRSVDIINVNNHSDEGLIQTDISESLRYINAQYLDNMTGDSYWNSEEGKAYLTEIFSRYTNKETANKETYTGEISNPTVNDSDRKIKITINDYTVN